MSLSLRSQPAGGQLDCRGWGEGRAGDVWSPDTRSGQQVSADGTEELCWRGAGNGEESPESEK